MLGYLLTAAHAAFDYGTNIQVPTRDVTYQRITLPEQVLHEPILYLGMLLTFTYDYKSEKDHDTKATQKCVEVLGRANSSRRSTTQLCNSQSSLYFGKQQDWYRGGCPNSKTSRQCGSRVLRNIEIT